MNKESIDLIIEKHPKLKQSQRLLEKMQVNAYCIHRSWGFGQIKEFDGVNCRLVVDFEKEKKGHIMDPVFCVDKLEILEETSLLVRKRVDSENIEEMIESKPVELVIEYLMSTDGKASAIELEQFFVYLLGEQRFKKWWGVTKKLLVRDPRISAPVKKTDVYSLRAEPLTPQQEILKEFYANRNPKKKILLAEKLYQLSNSAQEIAEDLPKVLEELTVAVQNEKQLTQAERLQGVWVRNDLARFLDEDVEKLKPTAASIIKGTENLIALTEALPVNYYKRLLDLIGHVYSDDLAKMLLELLKESTGKFTNECVNFLIDRDYTDLVAEAFEKWLNENTLKGPVIYWILKNRNLRRFYRITKNLINHRLLSALFHAIDHEILHSQGNRRILLADILSEDVDLIGDLLSDANDEIARDLAHCLLLNQGFENLTKRSILARFIKQFPSVQTLITGNTIQEAEKLLVSEFSLELRKKEYELLITQKIPENKEAIAIAREHGDLRENSEYKMARQDQDMLFARKALLESEIAHARVTDFSDAAQDKVSIGSILQIAPLSSGKISEYAILGAWDSHPEKNILSYKTPLAQKLLYKAIGDKITVDIDGHEETWTIKKIDRWIDHKGKYSLQQ